MEFEEKERLAMTRDGGLEASGLRVRAARLFAGLGQEDLGKRGGISKAAISNIEKGRSFPARPLMSFFFREHRIDYNFLIVGEFRQLPMDVQDRLFPILASLQNEAGQESN